MEFEIGEVETRMRAGACHAKMTNYLVQAQQCDLAAYLTEQMNKYPKGSPERALLKAARFGVVYGKGDQTITVHTDYSPEWKKNMCPKCINSDRDCHCITKEEAPFGTFICENGEMFEPLVGE